MSSEEEKKTKLSEKHARLFVTLSIFLGVCLGSLFIYIFSGEFPYIAVIISGIVALLYLVFSKDEIDKGK